MIKMVFRDSSIIAVSLDPSTSGFRPGPSILAGADSRIVGHLDLCEEACSRGSNFKCCIRKF